MTRTEGIGPGHRATSHGAALVGATLYLTALTGTAMGLAISACCGCVLRAQQWLAYLMLAQILLTL